VQAEQGVLAAGLLAEAVVAGDSRPEVAVLDRLERAVGTESGQRNSRERLSPDGVPGEIVAQPPCLPGLGHQPTAGQVSTRRNAFSVSGQAGFGFLHQRLRGALPCRLSPVRMVTDRALGRTRICRFATWAVLPARNSTAA